MQASGVLIEPLIFSLQYYSSLAASFGPILSQIGRVLYAAVPLAIYFLSMFIGSFYLSFLANATYAQATTLAFTAASNNFELALAVAVGTFGLNSGEALMSVVGALIEIPTMLSLVKMAEYFKRAWYQGQETTVPSKLSRNGVKGTEESVQGGEPVEGIKSVEMHV